MIETHADREGAWHGQCHLVGKVFQPKRRTLRGVLRIDGRWQLSCSSCLCCVAIRFFASSPFPFLSNSLSLSVCLFFFLFLPIFFFYLSPSLSSPLSTFSLHLPIYLSLCLLPRSPSHNVHTATVNIKAKLDEYQPHPEHLKVKELQKPLTCGITVLDLEY